jgi:hypothetical protein
VIEMFTGEVVKHLTYGIFGVVLEVSADDYRVRSQPPTAIADTLDEDYYYTLTDGKAWWRAQDTVSPVKRSPYRQYLAARAAEEDPIRSAQRATRACRHGGRRYAGHLSEEFWERMYWRLCNRRPLNPYGQYECVDLGREHWRAAANDCLDRRTAARDASWARTDAILRAKEAASKSA